MCFMGPGQYISPLSSKLACGQKRLSSVERDCPMLRKFVPCVREPV